MDFRWWKNGVFYQVYPMSFKDTDNDGVGDLNGIIEKLDYLKALGITGVWLCPIYASPLADNGYDISDYRAIQPRFGTMEIFETMIKEIHKRDMYVIMDLVLNHTSDEHPWFIESKSSKDNPKRDYYHWRDEPNNWKSFFEPTAWELDPTTNQYYLHLFHTKQPDLKWENPEVRREMYEIMHYWLEKGVDGFRVDCMSMISKQDFKTQPLPNFNDTIDTIYSNGPRLKEFINEMVENVVDKWKEKGRDVYIVGEGPGVKVGKFHIYEKVSSMFHFRHMFLDHGPGGRYDRQPLDFVKFKQIFVDMDKEMTWPSIFLSNHDFPRLVSRFGDDKKYRVQSAKLFGLLLMTMRGTSFVYQGDEIGMTNFEFKTFDDFKDPKAVRALQETKTGEEKDNLKSQLTTQARDHARTPIQWNSQPNAGFCKAGVTPWMKVVENYKEINVEKSEKDPGSVLNFYKRVINLKTKNRTLTEGEFEVENIENKKIFSYFRSSNEQKFWIILNVSSDEVVYKPATSLSIKKIIISNYSENEVTSTEVKLKPWEAILIEI